MRLRCFVGLAFVTFLLGPTGCGDDDAGDPCSGVTCGGHGECHAGDQGAYCVCDPDYQPQGLTCVEAPQENCGNGKLDSDEECDGDELGGKTCQDLSFQGGRLKCDANCRFDTSECVGGCGNGVAEAGEECDGSDLRGQTCQEAGFTGGTLQCDASCKFDTSECVGRERCGNGVCGRGESPATCPDDCPRVPYQVMDLCAGAAHACAVVEAVDTQDRFVVCWGDDTYGQLGVPAAAQTHGPVLVPDLVGVPATVACGASHTCARMDNGDLYCWGNNDKSQLTWQLPHPATPALVSVGYAVQDVAAGGETTCAVVDMVQAVDLLCWGDNASHEIDCSATEQYDTPAPVDTGFSSFPYDGLGVGDEFVCVAAQA